MNNWLIQITMINESIAIEVLHNEKIREKNQILKVGYEKKMMKYQY